MEKKIIKEHIVKSKFKEYKGLQKKIRNVFNCIMEASRLSMQK